METWLVMEYCSRGTLKVCPPSKDALSRGKVGV